MTPAARVQAASEVLDAILDGVAAEKALSNWARRSRYAGSKDRAAVRDHVFQALRCRRSYGALGGAVTGRSLMIGALRDQSLPPDDIFTGAAYAPAALSEDERTSELPSAQDMWDLPDWLIAEFQTSIESTAEATAQALRHRAPVMARVNLAKTSVDTAVSALAQAQITAHPDPIAQGALKLTDGARRVAHSTPYAEGLIELQDGSSQAAMERLSLLDQGKVLDYCAGGGGKTLAMAGRGQAQWFAHDAMPQRMKDLPPRAARAGVVVQVLSSDQLDEHAPYDLVLCDVPCSGSGTWRRTPEAKWALTPDRLAELGDIQASILTKAATLVAPGGVLAYATCSVLRQENEDQITGFLQAMPSWSRECQHRWPVSDAGDGFFLSALRCEIE